MAVMFQSCKDDDPKPFKQVVKLKIEHIWGDTDFILNSVYVLDTTTKADTLIPSRLIYHINHLKLFTEDSVQIDADHEYYMYNHEEKKFYPEDISFTTPQEGVKYYVNSIEFTIGIEDSLTSVNNLLSGFFTSPMYWGMIMGYVNFKFEATSPQVNTVIYHVGGYLDPYKNFRTIRLSFKTPYLLEKQNILTLQADIYKVFNAKNVIDIHQFNDIHAPNDNSVKVADNISKMFSFKSILPE